MTHEKTQKYGYNLKKRKVQTHDGIFHGTSQNLEIAPCDQPCDVAVATKVRDGRRNRVLLASTSEHNVALVVTMCDHRVSGLLFSRE